MSLPTEGTEQPQQTQAETVDQVQTANEGQTPQANPGQHEGFQKRIDQLTAQRHELDREWQAKYEAQQAQMNRLLEIMAAGQQAQTHGAPPADPWADVAAEDRARLERVLQAKLSPLERQLAEVTRKYEATTAVQQIQQYAQQDPPQVVQLAQQLMQAWIAQGKGGWVPEDALIYARGKLLPADAAARAAQARNERGQFVASAQHVTSTQGPPPPAVRPAQGLPADIDRRAPEEQVALYEKHLDGKFF